MFLEILESWKFALIFCPLPSHKLNLLEIVCWKETYNWNYISLDLDARFWKTSEFAAHVRNWIYIIAFTLKVFMASAVGKGEQLKEQ